MRRDLRLRVRAAMFVAAVVASLAGCGKSEEGLPPASPKQAAPPPPIIAQNLKPSPPATPVLPERIAELHGLTESPVVAPKAGYLVKFVRKEGEFVAEGEAIFLIDSKPLHVDAKNDLATIAAPVAGFVGHAEHGPGDWIDAGERLTSISGCETMRAEMTLPAELYQQNQAYFEALGVKAIPPPGVELILPDGTIYPQKGSIVTVSYLAQAKVVRIQADFPNPGHVLRPVEFVKLRQVAP